MLVEVQIEKINETKYEYKIKAKSNYKSRSVAHNVEINIPVPNDLQKPVFTTRVGVVKYEPDLAVISWKIKDFPGQTDFSMATQFNVPKLRSEKSDQTQLKPISVIFEIPSFTVSGITVRYLKITESSGYTGYPYVKYLTINGDYNIRMPI